MLLGVGRVTALLTVLLVVLTTLLAGAARGAPGGLDPTFGTGGIVYRDDPGGASLFDADLDVQPDGKVVLGGSYRPSGGTSDQNNSMVTRLNADGTLDDTFGSGGMAVHDFGSGLTDTIQAPIVDPSTGKIITVGHMDSPASEWTLVVARWNADGSLDTSFGTGGAFIQSISGNGDSPSSAVIQPDGKIVVSGSIIGEASGDPTVFVIRLTSTGELDPTFDGSRNGGIFGSPGRLFDYVGGGEPLVQPDGKIVVAATVNGGIGLSRYASDGAFDTSFGPQHDGVAAVAFPHGAVAWGIARQPDGKLLVSGGANTTSSGDEAMALARFSSSGATDTSFGSGGKVVTNFGPNGDESEEVLVQPNGRIVSAGVTTTNTTTGSSDSAFARYLSNGALDTKFGTGGKMTAHLAGQTFSFANGAAFTPDGRIVVGGPAGTGSNRGLFAARLFGDKAILDSFTPDHGPAGTQVTIAGQNFVGITGVKFGTVSWPFHVDSPSQITATAPSAALDGALSITNGGGTTSLPDSFSVEPTVSGFSPAAAPAATNVTIAGSGLAGATSVTFAGEDAQIVSSTATSVVAKVPGTADVGPIEVTTPNGTDVSTLAFKPLPRLVVPATPNQAGDHVALAGTNLLGATLKIGTLAVPPEDVADLTATGLTLTIPENALTGSLAVTTAGGAFTAGQKLLVRPTIDHLAPDTALTGTLVVITGNTFTGTTSVKVNNVTWPFHVDSATQVTATVPSSATSGTLTVTNPGGATPGGTFSVLPKVTSFSPTSAAANSTVTVNGTGLGGATGVTFGGVAAMVVSSTANQVKATVPADAPVGPIDVTTPVDHFVTAAGFKPLPRLTALTAAPPVQAGDAITLTGTNLLAPTILKVGSLVVPADDYSATDATHLAVTVPDSGLTGSVVLTTAGGATTASGSLKIRPTIADMTPTAAKTGTLVTITGKTLKGTSAVRFGTVSGSSLKVATTGTSLTVVVPSTASTSHVMVTNAGGTTDAGAFTVQPKISSFSPTSGREGTLVTVNGSGLANVDSVSFNGVGAAPVTVSATKVTVRVPPGATTGKIHVDGDDGADTSVANFTVTLAITDFSPAGGLVGDAVTITGVGFGTSNTVQFGSLTAFVTARTTTSITALVPSGAVTAPIKVKVGTSQATSAAPFVVASYDSLDVDDGIPGSVVRISGSGFDTGTTVDFVGSDGSPAPASVTLDAGGTFLDATVPASAVSGAITVHTPYGAIVTGAFRVPRILSISPTSGGAGTSVTINGSDFSGATAVDFNGVSAGAAGEGFVVVSDTKITASVPVSATTGPVHVETADGLVSGPTFTVSDPLSITR